MQTIDAKFTKWTTEVGKGELAEGRWTGDETTNSVNDSLITELRNDIQSPPLSDDFQIQFF